MFKAGQKLYKIASYIFIGFVTLLIILMFGMPDFIGTSAGIDRGNAAKVGDHVITRSDVAKERENLARQYGNLPQQYLKMLENQALQRIIDRKVLQIAALQSGLAPKQKATDAIVADYIKTQFPQYMTDKGYDIDAFEKEQLGRGVTFSQIQRDVAEQKTLEYMITLLQNVAQLSYHEARDQWQMQNVKLSYELAVIDATKKNEILRNQAPVQESEIQQIFQEEYKKNNPEAQLNDLTRQAILSKLVEKNRAAYEKTFLDNLKSILQEKGIKAAAARYNVKTFSLKDISIAQSLDSQRPAGVASLKALEEAAAFRKNIFKSAINRPLMPINTASGIYLVAVTKRDTSALEEKIDITKIAEQESETPAAEQNENNEVDSEAIKNIARGIESRYMNRVLSAMIDDVKASMSIDYMVDPDRTQQPPAQ